MCKTFPHLAHEYFNYVQCKKDMYTLNKKKAHQQIFNKNKVRAEKYALTAKSKISPRHWHKLKNLSVSISVRPYLEEGPIY